jgi:hypothetical protein
MGSIAVCGKSTGRERRVERNEFWATADKSRFQYQNIFYVGS